MEYDFSSMSDEELDKALASAQTPAPAAPQGDFDVSAMSDEELNAALASAGGEAPRMTREERIAQNQRAIERAQRPGEGEGGIGEALLEGAKGAGRAVKDIGGGIVGMVSGVARLAGTPVRLATGWEGLHRLADTIDSSYENFGRDALMSEYGENPDGWGYALGRAGEKIAGVAGSLAALGGVGKAVGAAGTALKMAGHAKTAAAVANTLPLMFGNDAAVRAYDTARANGKSKGEAAALAGLNGAIHFLGFKAFENQSLKKMLNIGPEVEVMMPKWADALAEEGGQSFSSLIRGTRNGMVKYIAAERGKGALKAGGIMGLQDMLSDPVMQVAEGADIDDIDFSRMLKAGAHGVGEGALMEGLMGGAAILRSQNAAKKFVADKYFRGKDYKVMGADGKMHDEPGLLNNAQGRMMLMKQNPSATERVLDIVEHGGTPRPAELDAAFLPPDMTKVELEKFAADWRKDLKPYVEDAWNADQPTRSAPPVETAAEAPRREFLSAEEAAEQRGDAQAAIEQPPKQETPDETGNGAAEAPAQPEQAEVVVPPTRAEARPVEGSEAPAEAPDAGVVEPAAGPKPAEKVAEPAQEPQERVAVPETAKETPEPAKPVEAAPRAPDATEQNQAAEPIAEKKPEAEAKPGAMSPTQKRNRLNKIQGILNRIGPDGSLEPKAFRYGENNPGGLKLGDLKMLDDPANDGWQYEMGLPKERADELRNAVRTAYEEQRAASPNRKDKANDSGQNTYSVSASKALERLAAKPNDLKRLGVAHEQVSAAMEAAKRQGDEQGAKFWEDRLAALNGQIEKLEPNDQAKVAAAVQDMQSEKSAMERKGAQSLETGEGKTIDVADGAQADEYSDAFRLGRIEANDDDASGASTAQAPVRKPAKDNAVGNRRIQLETKNGITSVVWRNDMGEVVKRAPLEALRAAAKISDEAKALVDKLEAGEDIRFSRAGEPETQAERDLRYAMDTDYQKYLKDHDWNDAEAIRERYEREGAEMAAKHGKLLLRNAEMELHLDREYDPNVDGDGKTIEDPDSGRVVGMFNRETNKLKLFRGATVKTLVHELGGHATLKYAEQLAEQGDRALLDRINKVIDETPQEIKDDIRKRYTQGEKESAEAYEARLRDEVWAAIRERNSPAMEKAIKTLQGKAWYNRAWQAFKDAWKGLLSRMGFNRADLSKIDKMSNDEFLDYLDRTMSEGKTIGQLEKGGAEGTRARVTDSMAQGIVDNLLKYKGKVKFSDFTKKIVNMVILGSEGPGVTLELPDFDRTKVIFSSPKEAQSGKNAQGIDHSAFGHNWETGTAYDGRYTWPEFDRAFRPESLKRAVKGPDGIKGREKITWTVDYPAENGREPYSLTWRMIRNERTGELVNLFTTRGEREYPPPFEAKTPEGGQLGNTHAEGVADPSSSGDRKSVPNSAAENQGGVRESRAPKPAGYKIMDDVQTKGEKFEEKFIDARAPIRNVQEEVGGVKEVFDPRTGYTDHKKSTDFVAAADKANGRVEYEIRDLQHKSDEISKDLAKAALKGESSAELEADFDLYLQCRHAAERNRTIAERNGVTYDPDYYYGMGMIERGGTRVGLSENVANDILADMTRKYGNLDAFDKAAQKVYEINRADIQRRVEAGRLTVQDANQYLYRWQNYVPLKTDMERLEPDAFNSSTATMRRNEFRKARGRADADIADSPLAASILQAEQGIRGSVKNETLNVLANLVRHAEAEGKPIAEIVEGRDMPQGTGWTFEFGDGSKAVAGGEMKLAGNHPEIILFKEDGKLKAIRFEKGANGRGLAVAKSASGENMGKWGSGTEWIPRFTHWMSAMRTQYSPEFTVSNLLADHLEAYQALVGRYGIKGGTAAFGRMVASEMQNFKDLRNYLRTGIMSRDVGEAVRGGLLTKGGVASEGLDFEGGEQNIRNRIEDFRRKESKWRDMSLEDLAKSGWKNITGFISMANELAEYSTRMGIFSALKKQGVPVKDAIKFARDATVNFNRKGTAMPYINGLYMFANASVQGAVRSVQAMQDAHGKELVGLLTAVGVAKAVIDNYLGNDDDREKEGGRNARNLSEYDRKHNVGVPIGGGYQFVPLRFRGPYAAIPYLAQTAANVAMGNKTPGQGATALVRELGDQVTDVVGGNGIMNDKGEFDGSLAMQSLAPSVVDPFVQLATGKDYKGDDRRAKVFDKTAPVSSNGKRNTFFGYKDASKGLNWLTGGNELRKGLVDVAPEDLQLVTEFLGGGVMRDVHNLVATGVNIFDASTGGTPERTLSEVPFLRRIVKEYPENTSRYYDAMDAYERDKAEFKKTVDIKSKAAFGKTHPYVRPMSDAGKSRVDVLSERIKELSHLERGEVKSGQKWVERKTPLAESQKETFRKRRLELQAKVLGILGE